MKSIELFTGAGGLALGIHQAGFEHQLLAESDKSAHETLLSNSRNGTPGASKWIIRHQRVESLDFQAFEGVDLVAAGIPCQPFSNAGKRTGLADPRNMFPTFAKVLAAVRPRAFLLENVNGLASRVLEDQLTYLTLQLSYPQLVAGANETWHKHHARLADRSCGGGPSDESYVVAHQVLNAADHGVPQIRRRVFFVGFRGDVAADWDFPVASHSKETLLGEQWVTGDYWRRHEMRPPRRSGLSSSLLQRLAEAERPATFAWRTVRDAFANLGEPLRRESRTAGSQHVRIPGARSYSGHTGSVLDYPAKALNAGVHGVPGGENMLVYPNGRVRYFTVRECARIQTFPDHWTCHGEWSQVTRQLGNAVPVAMARVMANSIIGELKRLDEAPTIIGD